MIYIEHVSAWIIICSLLSVFGKIQANSWYMWVIGVLIVSGLMAVPTVILHTAYLTQ